MARYFAHFSDWDLLAHESDHNQEVLLEQAQRQRNRDEAMLMRAVFYGVRWAQATTQGGKYAYSDEDVQRMVRAMEE